MGFGALAYDPMTGLPIKAKPIEDDIGRAERAATTGAPLAAAESTACAESPAAPYHALLDKPSGGMLASGDYVQLDPAGGK